MASILSKRGKLDNVVTYEHICDSYDDLATIPQDQINLGSVAVVLEGQSGGFEVYMANSEKEWGLLSITSGGGGGGGSGGDTQAIKDLIASEFSSSVPYKSGDYVFKNDILYKRKSYTSTDPGEWNINDWEVVTATLYQTINNVNNKSATLIDPEALICGGFSSGYYYPEGEGVTIANGTYEFQYTGESFEDQYGDTAYKMYHDFRLNQDIIGLIDVVFDESSYSFFINVPFYTITEDMNYQYWNPDSQEIPGAFIKYVSGQDGYDYLRYMYYTFEEPNPEMIGIDIKYYKHVRAYGDINPFLSGATGSNVIEMNESNIMIRDANNGSHYYCGTLTNLSVDVPSTGEYVVNFTSGSTPTTLSYNGITWPAGFNPASLYANTVYKFTIDSNGYATVDSWGGSNSSGVTIYELPYDRYDSNYIYYGPLQTGLTAKDFIGAGLHIEDEPEKYKYISVGNTYDSSLNDTPFVEIETTATKTQLSRQFLYNASTGSIYEEYER